MQPSRIAVLTATVLILTAGWASSAPRVRQAPMVPADKVLTLADAIGLAMKNQPAVRQAYAQVDAQSGVVGQARSQLLPDATITGFREAAGSSQTSRTPFSGSVNQLIYDFGRSRWGLTEAQLRRSASVESLRATTADTILNVKLAYYDLLRTTALVRVFEENLKTSTEHVNLAQARLDAGTAPRADLLKAQAAEASSRVNLIAARNAADQARVDLNEAMGVDVRSQTQIAETSEPDSPVPDANQVVELAIANRPEVREALDNATAAYAGVKSAKTGNLPAFGTSLGGSRDFATNPTSTAAWQWLVNLQWTPFDSGLTRGAVTTARAQLVTADEALYQSKQSVSRDAVAARLNLLAAAEALVASKVEVASATEDLEAATGRYKAGAGIFLEVLDAQSGLLKAQVDELSSRYGQSKARAGLERATGTTRTEGI